MKISVRILSRYWGDYLLYRLSLPPRYAWSAVQWLARRLRRAQSRPADSVPLRARICPDGEVGRVREEYLSVALDVSLLVGGYWWEGSHRSKNGVGALRIDPIDLDSKKLRAMASHFAGSMLRIGGTEADRLYYALETVDGQPREDPARPHAGARESGGTQAGGETAGEARLRRDQKRVTAELCRLPPGFKETLTAKRLNELSEFARACGFRIIFAVNAGAGNRDRNGVWTPQQARCLMRYAADHAVPIAAWELGNEVNGFPFVFGRRYRVGAQQYVDDFSRFYALVRGEAPGALAAGPASSFWPIVGETFPIIPLLAERDTAIDAVTWHYYPQQSRRSPIATRRAKAYKLLDGALLDEAGGWARHVRRLVRRMNPDRKTPTERYGEPNEVGSHAARASGPVPEIWLGETGHAQLGGEPGVSDRFASSLWWLDQLGLMARSGTTLCVRQSLVGSDYGLLHYKTFDPNPDFWASVLWRRLMGRRVFRATLSNRSRYLRVYAHECACEETSTCFLVLNLSRRRRARVELEGVTGTARLYLLHATHLLSGTVRLNDRVLSLGEEWQLPDFEALARTVDLPIDIPPASAAFLAVPVANE